MQNPIIFQHYEIDRLLTLGVLKSGLFSAYATAYLLFFEQYNLHTNTNTCEFDVIKMQMYLYEIKMITMQQQSQFNKLHMKLGLK